MIQSVQQSNTIPDGLYIPCDAMQVVLDSFVGPLDLLLYLIKRQNIDILSLSIMDITSQYLSYISIMKATRFELAADYLVMAATLAQIKSNRLLPQKTQDLEQDHVSDPVAILIKQLKDYDNILQLSSKLAVLHRGGGDCSVVHIQCPVVKDISPMPNITLGELTHANKQVSKKHALSAAYKTSHDIISLDEKMDALTKWVSANPASTFAASLCHDDGREGVAVSLLALLALTKDQKLDWGQVGYNSPIHFN